MADIMTITDDRGTHIINLDNVINIVELKNCIFIFQEGFINKLKEMGIKTVFRCIEDKYTGTTLPIDEVAQQIHNAQKLGKYN